MQQLAAYRIRQITWGKSRLPLQQQLQEGDKVTISLLSSAIEKKRLQRWVINQQCFNRVCRDLKIPWQYKSNATSNISATKFILVLYIKTDAFTNQVFSSPSSSLDSDVRFEARFEGRRSFWLYGFFCLPFCLRDEVFPRSVITYAHSTARGQTPD